MFIVFLAVTTAVMILVTDFILLKSIEADRKRYKRQERHAALLEKENDLLTELMEMRR